MKRLMSRVSLCLILAVFFWCGTLLSDSRRLHEELIRLHVVANSDSQEDQQLKLRVRDAVTESLKQNLRNVTDADRAKQYIQEKLPYIQSVAQHVLEAEGCSDPVAVSFCQEAFATRAYDTFILPAGIYNSLRILIGTGQGHNWWCVVFPELCIPVSTADFREVAAGAGFPEGLNGALSGENGYELRFGILDAIGKLENLLSAG